MTENQVIKIGNVKQGIKTQSRSIYSVGGVSPTLGTMQGGNRQPFVVIQYENSKNQTSN